MSALPEPLTISKESAVKMLRDLADEIENDCWSLEGVEIKSYKSIGQATVRLNLLYKTPVPEVPPAPPPGHMGGSGGPPPGSRPL